jgi:hypothetical protein
VAGEMDSGGSVVGVWWEWWECGGSFEVPPPHKELFSLTILVSVVRVVGVCSIYAYVLKKRIYNVYTIKTYTEWK